MTTNKIEQLDPDDMSALQIMLGGLSFHIYNSWHNYNYCPFSVVNVEGGITSCCIGFSCLMFPLCQKNSQNTKKIPRSELEICDLRAAIWTLLHTDKALNRE